MTTARRFPITVFVALVGVFGARGGSAVPPSAAELQRAFKGLPSVEKAELVTGKEATLAGGDQPQVLVLTVNGLYEEQELRGLELFRRKVMERFERVARGGAEAGVLVMVRSASGRVYRTFPLAETQAPRLPPAPERRLSLLGSMALAWSPDGTRLVASGNDGLTLWTLEGAVPKANLAAAPPFMALAFDDGEAVVAFAGDGVYRWRPGTPRLTSIRTFKEPITLAAAADDRAVVVALGVGGQLQALDVPDGETRTLTFGRRPSALAASRAGRLVAWADGGSHAMLHGHGLEEREVGLDQGRVSAVALSPDGRLLAIGGAAGAVTVWSCANGALVSMLPRHGAAISALAFAPDGRTLAAGDAAGVTLHDLGRAADRGSATP